MTWWRGSRISVSAFQRFAAALHRRPVTAPSSRPTPGTALRRALLPNGVTTPSAVSMKATGSVIIQDVHHHGVQRSVHSNLGSFSVKSGEDPTFGKTETSVTTFTWTAIF